MALLFLSLFRATCILGLLVRFMLDRRRDMVAFAIHTMDTAVSISTNGASNQTQRAINEKPAAVYVLSRCGFGSQMMNLLGHQFYFEVVQKRRFLVDESLYSYRRSEDQGVLTGFFTPDMPVLDRVRDRNTFAQRWLPASENERDPFWAVDNENTDDYIIEEYPNRKRDLILNNKPVVYLTTYSHGHVFRGDGIHLIFPDESMDELYSLLKPYACTSFQFNRQTLDDIHKLYEERGISGKWKHEHDDSVAFHVRRSDKVAGGESRKYEADEYVQKMIETVGEKNISNCFVASDDYAAVEEMKVALLQRNVSCNVSTLADTSRQGTSERQQMALSYEDTLAFLAEISILINSTYFIGAMNSNIGSFVTLMRSCPAYNRGENLANSTTMFRSYGVDQDEWVLI